LLDKEERLTLNIMARKKVEHDGSEGSSLLQMMTVSLFIILLAFFIMLNAIAVVNDDRKRVALGSVLKSFGVLSGGWSVLKGQSDNWAMSAFPSYHGPIELKNLSNLDPHLLEQLHVTSTQRGSLITIPAAVLFQPQQSVLKADAAKVLPPIVKIIKSNAFPVEINGYCHLLASDSENTASDREISAMQALEVMLYLMERGQVSSSRLTAMGWGKQRAAVAADTRESRLVNQRIEILLVHQGHVVKPRGGFVFKNFFFKAL
jgi:chemotaxis protein MotB